MKKDLAYVCNYFKALVIPDMPDDFVVAQPFRHGLTDDELRKGIAAFREFLYALFDKLSAEKDKIDVETGRKYDPYGYAGDHGNGNIGNCFPVIFDLTYILFALGIYGRLETEPEMKLTIHGKDMLTAICPLTGKYPQINTRLV